MITGWEIFYLLLGAVGGGSLGALVMAMVAADNQSASNTVWVPDRD